MAIFGWATGGASAFGPSTAFNLLPFQNYRSIGTWFEEYMDGLANELDIMAALFVAAGSRKNLLDPSYTPTVPAASYFGNTTTAPASLASGAATMLDLLAVIAGVPWPIDTNLSVAQKQAIALSAQQAFKRKTVRRYFLDLATKMTDGVGYSWSVPPNTCSIIIGDGEPSPGYGGWVQSTAALSEIARPWVLGAVRTIAGRIFPAWGDLGVGTSQFRANYSSAGETVFPTGARINLLANEHFSSWSVGAPVSWTKVGTGTLTQSTSAPSINWEFTGNAAVFDFTSAVINDDIGLNQTTTLVNNQLTYRLQVDYAYTNLQNVGVLQVRITDTNPDGVTYYWNPTTATWGTAIYNTIIPPSAARGRFACDIVPQRASTTASTAGTSTITIKLAAICDGTATTKTTYTIYRVGLYEKYSLAAESLAVGERTLWLPLVDSAGPSSASRTAGTGGLLEPANAARTAYKFVQSSTGASFPYHPALSARGYRSHGTWTNIVKDSNAFTGASWTVANATATANAQISPIVGETVASATQLTATSVVGKVSQQLGAAPINPASKVYVGGVWAKKLTADASSIGIDMVSTSVQTMSYALAQSAGWQLLPFKATFGAGDVANLSLRIRFADASATTSVTFGDAYCYDVTSNPDVLYPPVARSGAAAVGVLNASLNRALTSNTGVSVLHSLTLRTLASVARGALGLTVVPTFDAISQPNGVIFDVAQAAAQNRIVLRVASGVLELRRWDNAGNQWVSSLTMTKSATPAAGQVTWLRDTSILVRCSWGDANTQLSAGNGNAAPGTKPGSWAPLDTSVAAIGVGNDWVQANQFEGSVTLLSVEQVGAPTT